MCGINGIYAFQTAADPPKEAELLATREHMRLRGPDGAGAWWNRDHHCALAHRRLSIIDLSKRANQPMISDDGRLVVVFNGEIYNYPDLCSELKDKGVSFRTTSDTEVLLHLYARHGADMVHRLRGMYAFAIWDDQRRALFLARDPYGIKPLYTSNNGGTFRFASQVKALLAGGQVSRDPDPAGLVGFHIFGSVPEPYTLYREIRALPAGHTQWVDSFGPHEPKPFVNIASVLAEREMSCPDVAGAVEKIRLSVGDSVRAHLLADVEVAVFLSSGIDSGALLGLMKDAGQAKIRAITLAFEEFRGTVKDEAPLAMEIAHHYGAEHIVRYVSEDEFRRDLPVILDSMDQPSIDGVNVWFVSKAAQEVGLKVALSGLGGDELFGGYPSYVDLPRWRRRFGAFAALPGLASVFRAILPVVAPELVRTQPKSAYLLDYIASWPGAYLLRRGLFLPSELPRILDADLVRQGLAALKPLDLISATITPDPGTDAARVCALESANYMRNQLLRDADWSGMAHSIEIRVPLVDFALLKELAPQIGSFASGEGKAALANAPLRPLPQIVTGRAKTGFDIPTQVWMGALSAGHPKVKDVDLPMGTVSRSWSQLVVSAFSVSSEQNTPIDVI